LITVKRFYPNGDIYMTLRIFIQLFVVNAALSLSAADSLSLIYPGSIKDDSTSASLCRTANSNLKQRHDKAEQVYSQYEAYTSTASLKELEKYYSKLGSKVKQGNNEWAREKQKIGKGLTLRRVRYLLEGNNPNDPDALWISVEDPYIENHFTLEGVHKDKRLIVICRKVLKYDCGCGR
jgi:hypothetical protein